MGSLLKKKLCKGDWFLSFDTNIRFHVAFGEDEEYIEFDDGDKIWYKNGKYHREDGPAIEWSNGDKHWYKNGELHREDGPAIEYANGDKEWWIDGKLIKKEYL